MFPIFIVLVIHIHLVVSQWETGKSFTVLTKLRSDLFKNYNGSMPVGKGEYLEATPSLEVGFIHFIDDDHGFMSVVINAELTWIDERLKWNPANYSGVREIVEKTFEFRKDNNCWMPIVKYRSYDRRYSELDLLEFSDARTLISYKGEIKTALQTMVTTKCQFSFGEYPNDYQNCSIMLIPNQNADEFRFVSPNGYCNPKFENLEHRAVRVHDLHLMGVESNIFYTFANTYFTAEEVTGFEYMAKTEFRFNLMFKRVNKLLNVKLSIPSILISMFLIIAGLFPNGYSIFGYAYCFFVEVMHGLYVSKILPNDIRGIPYHGALALCFLIETVFLFCWKVFSVYARNQKLFAQLPNVFADNRVFVLKFVFYVDRVVCVALCLQFLSVIYKTR